jgi:hypothetical protein
MSAIALVGATVVFAVLFYQIWIKVQSKTKKSSPGGGGLPRPSSTAQFKGMEENRKMTDDKQ